MQDTPLRSGDDAVAQEFSRLHSEVAPRLWAWIAVRMGASLRAWVDPEDVLQEVCCRAWRRFHDYLMPSSSAADRHERIGSLQLPMA